MKGKRCGVAVASVFAVLAVVAGAASAQQDYVLEFDGSSGYVEIPASTALGLQNFTVTAWFRAGTDVSDHRTMLSRESAEAHNDRNWWINVWDGTGALSARSSSPGEFTTLDSTVAVNDQQWHHVAMVMDSGSGVARLFLDGNQIMEQTGRGAPHTPNAPAAIGAQIRGGDAFRFYLGQVAEHRVYNRPLSAGEIANDMNGQVLSGIAGHWPLRAGSGGTAQDMSGNGNHGTIHGGVQWVAVTDHPVPSDPTPPPPGPQYALQFELGTEDHVAIGTDGMGATGTIEGWWWLDQVDAKQYFFGHTTRPPFGSRIQIYNEGGGQGLSVGLGASHALDRDIATLQTQTWHHIALVYDNGSYQVYLDGALVSSGSYEGLDEIGYAYIGNNASDGGAEAPGGLIADVRAWNTARSGSQIQANMNSRLSGGEGGLVGYWPLNDGSGTTANDLSPQGNHGSIEGPQWAQVDDLPIDAAPAPGPQNVLYFDGDDSWVNLPHDIIPDWTQPWGVEAWVKPDNVGDRHTIINLRGGDEGSSIDFYLYIQDGVLGWYNGSHSDSFGSFETGQWSHVAVLFDGSEFQVYQDGDHLGSHSVSEGTSSHPDVGSTIGGNQRGPLTYEFDGMMADVRLWRGQVPSGGMIASRMNQRLTGDEAGLLGYWRFDEGSGTTAGDSSGNGNDGTLEGTVAWAESFDLPIDRDELPALPDMPLTQAAALNFQGESDYVYLDEGTLNLTSHFSETLEFGLGFWVRFGSDGFSEQQNIMGTAAHPTGNNGWYIRHRGDGEIRMNVENGDRARIEIDTDIQPETWHFFYVTGDGSEITLYIDGELIDTASGTPGSVEEDTALHFGESGGDYPDSDFMLAQVAIWDYTVGQAVMNVHQALELTGDEDGLVGYWPIDEGEGDTVHDLSPNENHGTIVGAEWVSETMPDLAGMHWEDAVAALEAEGFSVRIQYVQTGMVAAGQVLAQSPGAGQTSAPYWPVVIQVESEAESFAPAAPACFLLVVMTGVLAAAGYRMRRRVRVS